RRSSNVLAGTTRNASGSKSVTAVITLFSVLAILDTFIVKRVIALVDGLEHKGAFRSVSVVTTAPAISHDGSITLHRPPRTLPTRSSLTQAVAQRLASGMSRN